jgi:hypothetical protein
MALTAYFRMFLNITRPYQAADLTVHLGDIALDAPGDGTQPETARAMCEGWPTPFRFLPGNHDIGDNPPGPEVPAKEPLEPIPDTDQDRVGEKVTGLGLLELKGDEYRFDLVCPDGLARNSFVDQPFYRALR